MSRIRLTWNNASTTIVEQRVYRSTSPLDIDDMPDPLAVLPRRNREYLDSTIEDGLAYYYAVSSVLPDYSELTSEEIKVEASPGESDPYWDNVVALLHFDGDYTDETGRVWTQTGEFLTSPDEKVFGSASAFFPSTGLRGLVTPSTPDLNLGSEDFTVECWINPRELTRQMNICGLYGYSFGRRSWDIVYEPNYYTMGSQIGFRISTNGSAPQAPLVSAAFAADKIGKWTHLAVTRSGSEFKMFFDGGLVSQHSSSISALVNLVDPFTFGTSGPNFVNSWDGYIDEFRITKGVARYTENFTPPTKAFPNN